MKKKKNLKQILFGSPSKKKQMGRKTIHAQLEETIAEREKLLPNWEKTFMSEVYYQQNDIHLQLAKTIVQFKREKQLLDKRLFATDHNKTVSLKGKSAAWRNF